MPVSALWRLVCPCVLALNTAACGATRVTPDTRGAVVTAGECGRGVVVVESDYQSSNVSLLAFDGSVLSSSLASSSTQGGGFALSLGADAAPPSSAATGANLVILDRTPKGVLHFVDIATAEVAAELAVGTGFSANPHDYLALSEHKAYLARYDSNPNPGREPWDQGGDILLVDPSLPLVEGRIDLASAMVGAPAEFTPHPSRLLRVGDRVFALLAAYAADYTSGAVSRLIELDPSSDSILSTLLLGGLKGCDALAAAPDGAELAVACTGAHLRDTPPVLDASGIAVIDIAQAPTLMKQFGAATFGLNPLGFSLDYAARGQLLFDTLGYFSESNAVASLDSLVLLDSATGAFVEVLRSEREPFTLGDVRCAPRCGACFVTDAERSGGSVLRFPIDGAGTLGARSEIRAETQIGLPPRYLGGF
jgi:hypothetical protein